MGESYSTGTEKNLNESLGYAFAYMPGIHYTHRYCPFGRITVGYCILFVFPSGLGQPKLSHVVSGAVFIPSCYPLRNEKTHCYSRLATRYVYRWHGPVMVSNALSPSQMAGETR